MVDLDWYVVQLDLIIFYYTEHFQECWVLSGTGGKVFFFFFPSDTVSGHTLGVLQALSECVRVCVSPTNISKSHHPLTVPQRPQAWEKDGRCCTLMPLHPAREVTEESWCPKTQLPHACTHTHTHANMAWIIVSVIYQYEKWRGWCQTEAMPWEECSRFK